MVIFSLQHIRLHYIISWFALFLPIHSHLCPLFLMFPYPPPTSAFIFSSHLVFKNLIMICLDVVCLYHECYVDLNMYIYSFYEIQKSLAIFLQYYAYIYYSISLLSFYNSNYVYIRMLNIVPQVIEAL